MNNFRTSLFLIIVGCMAVGVSQSAMGQNDLLSTLDSLHTEPAFKTKATFKATRVSIGQSVETRAAGTLEITWQNRFWNIPTETTTQSFIADKVNSRFELAYSVGDRLTLGAAYGTGYNSIDAFGKYRLLYQMESGKKTPFSLTIFQNVVHREKNPGDVLNTFSFADEIGATTQLLVARKINSNFSVQLAPTYIYRAADAFLPQDSQHQLALGFAGRYKIGRHVSVVSEYYYRFDTPNEPKSYGPFSLGVNWEVADLMLQFKMTNARNLVEDKIISKTFNNFNFRDGNFHFGFQATYTLHFKKNRKI